MHPLIAQNRSGISDICRRYHIMRLDVFGSAARGEDFESDHSDADFLVKFAPDAHTGLGEFFGAKTELALLLGRDVDLVEEAAVRNPYVLAGIQQSRELVYAA